jgi:hypothetical protein
MSCGNVNADVIASICNQVAVGGTGNSMYILNYSDIDFASSTVANNIISDITLKAGKTGYLFTTVEDTIMGEVTLNKGTYVDSFQHDLTPRILAKSESAKAFINNAIGARVVCIIPNLEEGTAGEIKWEAYGWDAGLELNELAYTTDYADQVVYAPKFGSSEKAREGSLPKSVYVTSLTATEAMLDALVAGS